MGKKNRRGRQKENCRKARYNHHIHERYTDKIMADEANKQKQLEYSKKIRELEREKLQRTVFITNVKDLRQGQNLKHLRDFMTMKYGPVEECVKDKFRGKRKKNTFPPARVRFQRKRDAEKIFGGNSLIQAESVRIPCPTAGHRGMIYVRPAQHYKSMVDDTDYKGRRITFSAAGLALGHWCPSEDDAYLSWKQTTDDDDILEYKRTEEWAEEISMNVTASVLIDLSSRLIEISFTKIRTHSVTFRFKSLRNYVDICCNDSTNRNEYSLIFALKHPPILESFVENLLDEDEPERERDVCIPGIGQEYFGRCLGVRIPIEKATLPRLLRHEGFNRLVNFGVLRPELRSLNSWSLQHSDEITIYHHSDIGPNLKRCLAEVDGQMANIHEIDERLGFVLRSLVDQGRFSWYHAFDDLDENGWNLFDLLAELYCRYGKCNELIQILNSIGGESGATRFPCQLFSAINNTEDPNSDITPPSYCMHVPRALLTPCQTRVLGHEIEMSNRVLRWFVEEKGFSPNSFLRAQVGDENGKKLFNQSLSGPVESSLVKRLLNGILINGRHYTFLAYSSSQLKESSVWLVYLEHGYTVEQIRRELGDFSACPSASKYAARIGQCFSTTVKGLPGNSIRSKKSGAVAFHHEIKDVMVSPTAVNTQKIHSDGTGLISRENMDLLLKEIPFAPKDPKNASIVQIRFGGVKGTLTAWDFEDVKFRTNFSFPRRANVLVRPSMTKFEAPYTNLEVCSVGANVPYHLNRNVILLLSALGVSNNIFVDIQAKMLNDLDKMLVSNEKAMEVAPRLSGPDSVIRGVIGKMLQAGLSPGSEPFLFSLLHAIRSHHLFGLRKKSRIYVDKGAVLMGGLDETGEVPEGCVHVQITQRGDGSSQGESQLVTGPVLVTKHPVMHPGDVRMLLAVDIPALRDHKNVILFSRHGERPEADKMAGSDLDGDEFAVTWDSRLFLGNWNGLNMFSDFFPSTQSSIVKKLQRANHEPLDYEPEAKSPPPLPDDDGLKTKALIEHFINHAKNDNLGRIAMLWLDHASMSENGAKCNGCLELAKLHSIAVDFPKSGIPAEIPRKLSLSRATRRAHWREYKFAEPFQCNSVVGKLYDEVIKCERETTVWSRKAIAGRSIDKYGQVLMFVENNNREELDSAYDPAILHRMGFTNFDDLSPFLSFADNNKDLYDEDVFTLMNRYKIRSEGELITGCIRKLHKLHKRREHDIAQEIRRQVGQIISVHRERFLETIMEFCQQSEDESYETNDAKDCDDIDDHDDISLKQIEDVLADKEFSISRSSKVTLIQQTALRLAAAYYYVTYCTKFWDNNEQKTVLFGFPWVICADVIYMGLEIAGNRDQHPQT